MTHKHTHTHTLFDVFNYQVGVFFGKIITLKVIEPK